MSRSCCLMRATPVSAHIRIASRGPLVGVSLEEHVVRVPGGDAGGALKALDSYGTYTGVTAATDMEAAEANTLAEEFCDAG